MRCTERTPIDDDAENAEIRPRRRVSTCQFRVIHLEYNAPQSSELSEFAVLPPFRRRRVNCWVLPRCRPLKYTRGISASCRLAEPGNFPPLHSIAFCFPCPLTAAGRAIEYIPGIF